ncbi:major facilitator superfamily domain-containing protein [Mycena leptocephala]|nr:major facilitator superfamily domain-containing protein [Mycena leptocephala]
MFQPPFDLATSVQSEVRKNRVLNRTELDHVNTIQEAFLGLAVCTALASLDSVIIATALPNISSAFSAGAVVSWVPAAYMLTSMCFQPLLSDIFGRRSALALTMSLFMLGSLLSGFSKTITQLIVFRGIAGAGRGGVQSMMQIVVSDIVTLRERYVAPAGRHQSPVIGVGYAIGPPIGGALSQHVGWQWCIWITIPFSFVATCVVIFILPLKPVNGNIRSKLLAVDYLGAFLTLAGRTLFILPLIWGGITFPWKSSVVLAPLLSSMAVVALFCFWEWKGARLPIVPSGHVTVTGVFIAMFVNGFVFFSSLYYLPQVFQLALGYDSLHAGIFLVPFLVVQSIASWLAGMLVSRTGHYSTIIQLGFGIWAIACGCISTIRPGSHKALVVYMVVAGSGSGQISTETTTIAVQASVPKRGMSVVTAMRQFIRLFGGTLSLAVTSTLVNNKLRIAMTVLNIPCPPHPSENRALAGDGDRHTGQRFHQGPQRDVYHAATTVLATIASVVLIKHKELTHEKKTHSQPILLFPESQMSTVPLPSTYIPESACCARTEKISIQ